MSDRTEQLRQIMYDHNLSADDVGALINRAASTVRVWRSQGQHKRRTIPEHTLAVLITKLEAGKHE